MHVGSCSEPPELPSELSMDAKNFILACLKRNPSDRPNVRRLLKHPFISGIQGSIPRQSDDLFLPTFNSVTSEISFNSIRAHNKIDTYSVASSGRSVVPAELPPVQTAVITESPVETEEAKDLASANPNHNVAGPFGSLIPASMRRKQSDEVERKPEEEVVVLRRDPNETCKSHSDSYASGSNSSSSGGGGSLSYGSILVSQTSLELNSAGKKQEKGSETSRSHQTSHQTQQFRVVCVA